MIHDTYTFNQNKRLVDDSVPPRSTESVPLVAHTEKKMLAFIHPNTIDCVWCNQRLLRQLYESAYVKYYTVECRIFFINKQTYHVVKYC